MTPAKKIPILFPIELTGRELDFRLLLAHYTARPDNILYIGKSGIVNYLGRQLRGGVYVGKQLVVGGVSPKLVKYHELKKRGFINIHVGEEEPVFNRLEDFNRDTFLKQYDPRWQQAEDGLCAWGGFSAGVYRDLNPPCLGNIQVTGHPRFDLCKRHLTPYYETEVRRLKERFGRFILINTKFALASNFDAFRSCVGLFVKDRENYADRSYWIDYFVQHAQLQTHFIHLTNRLSHEFPGHSIVFRPHPGEDPAAYKAILSCVPRVEVATEGGVLPWLAAAEVLIHNGCTTALEAYQLTPKIINYSPVFDKKFDLELANLVGVTCTTEEDVIAEIRREGGNPSLSAEKRQQIRHIIDNFDTETMASEHMARVIWEAQGRVRPHPISTGLLQRARIRQGLHAIKARLGRIRKMWAKGLKPAANTRTLAKFDPLVPEDILARVEKLEQITGRKIRVCFHGPELMTVESVE
jgi:surface carbohydrate biosynthesis protein